MRSEKRIKFINADSSDAFQEKMNDSLEGLANPEVQIFGKYEGVIIYTEYIYEEEQKSIADLFEEAGCGATCGDCPFYEEPTDKRVKWIMCHNRRIRKDSNACDAYYLERRSDVSKIGKGNEKEEDGHELVSGCASDFVVESLPQTEWRDTVLAS